MESDGIVVALLTAGAAGDALAIKTGFGKFRFIMPWGLSFHYDQRLLGTVFDTGSAESAPSLAEINCWVAKPVGCKNPLGTVDEAISAAGAASQKFVFRQGPGGSNGQGFPPPQKHTTVRIHDHGNTCFLHWSTADLWDNFGHHTKGILGNQQEK